MPRLRLVGLILFITTIFLSLAAAATQTDHIRFTVAHDERAHHSHDGANDAEGIDFYEVPIVWPLGLTGFTGLLLWFGSAPREKAKPARRRSGRRRRR